MQVKLRQWLNLVLAGLALIAVVGGPSVVSQAQSGIPIAYGTSVAGTFAAGASPVAYVFNGAAGDLVTADVAPVASGALVGGWQPVVTLVGPAGEALVSSEGNRLIAHDTVAHIAHVLPTDGDYTLTISGQAGSGGDYILRLDGRARVASTRLEYGVPLAVDVPQNALTQHYDFEAEDCPTTLVVTPQEPAAFPFVVVLRNEQGREVAVLVGGDVQQDRVTVAARSGHYAVEVRADDPAAAGRIMLLVTCAGDAPGCGGPGDEGACPPCPSCPRDFDEGEVPVCPVMNLTAEPVREGLRLFWAAVPGTDHYWLHIYGLRDDDEVYLGAAGVPGDQTSFMLDHLFEGFWGYRFVVEAIRGDAPICSDETIIRRVDQVPTCPQLGFAGVVTDMEARRATWTWTPYPEADGYFLQLEAVFADGSTALVGSATFGPETIAWDTWHPPGLAATDVYRATIQIIIGDAVVCLEEATISFARQAAPCLVRVAQGPVQVHVGPGRHRSVFAMLEMGRDYLVLGQATDDAGNLWWQIDKTVFPGHEGVISLWVAEADVVEIGDCDEVPQEEPPPLIPDTRDEPVPWGPCGSCNTCGHPAEQCVTSPTGECVWDPATCPAQGPPPEGQQPPPEGQEPPPEQPTCVTVTATVNPPGLGTAGPITQGNCISEVAGIYRPGTRVQVQAFPLGGCWLASWSGCGASGSANPVTIVVNSSCTITAHIQCIQ